MSRNKSTTDFVVTVAFFSKKSLKGSSAGIADELDLDWFTRVSAVDGWALIFEKEIKAPHLQKTIEEMLGKTASVRLKLTDAGYDIYGIQLGIVPYISAQTNPGVAISGEALQLLMEMAKGIEVNIDIDIYLCSD
jgi:hypothetical protein